MPSSDRNKELEGLAEDTKAAITEYWKQLFPKVNSKFQWLAKILNFGSIDYLTERDYLAAMKFKTVFAPDKEQDYKWVIQHAKDLYAGMHSAFNDLDSKADAIIKYLGGGATFVTIAALLTVTPDTAPVLYFLGFAFALAIASIWFAMKARQPTAIPSPPSLEDAAKYVAFFKEHAESAYVVGIWHPCCVGLRVKNGEKASNVTRAGKFFIASLVSLLVTVLIWATIRWYTPIAASKSIPNRNSESIIG
jgi:hypothetical protein